MSDINDLIHTNAVIAFQQGEKTERQRITKLLEQLESEWKVWLGHYIEKQNSYETSRYRNYILACADLRDMVKDPDALIKGEKNDKV